MSDQENKSELESVLSLYNITLKRKSPNEIPGKDRGDLAKLFHTLGYKVGVELGTERGRYAQCMFEENPGVKIFCVDAWTVYEGYRCRTNHGHGEQIRVDNFFAECQNRLKKYDVEYIRKFSMDAVKDFEDNSLDFIYIDANHELRYITEDLVEWSKKIRPGGIVSGHDYLKPRTKGWLSDVAPAVFAYDWAYNINPWFVMGTQAETEHLNKGKARSFFWIKK